MTIEMLRAAGGPVWVLGLGRSGQAAIRLLRLHGCPVRAADAADTPALRAAAEAWRAEGIPVRLGAAPVEPEGAGAAVISPGIAPDGAWVAPLVRAGVPLIGELELGWSALRAPVLAITGSSGKSTLVKLCAEALIRAGLRAVAAGNYGAPLSEIAGGGETWDWVVAETSSFQLETARIFRPRIGLLLNLHPNHLDRHRTMAAYRAAKLRMFQNQESDEVAVVPVEFAAPAALPGAGRRVTFGAEAVADWRYEAGRVCGAGVRIDLRGTPFDNPVLGVAAAAAGAALAAAGIDAAPLEGAAAGFERLPHRQQRVAEIDGVTFIDDSKATTLAALTAGIAMAPGPVRLIAGGRLKERDLDGPKIMLSKKTLAVYLIGESAEVLDEAWRDAVPCRRCGTLEEAVAQAWQDARKGETILLSPGCASFDQFRGYDDRGRRYQVFIQQLNSRGRL